MKNEIKKIAISDLGLASLLVTLHFDLIGMERVNEKRINFMFVQTKYIERVVNDYWAGIETFISAQSLFNNQKILKNRLYSFK